ncbi:hypothetical protein TNCV_3842721 [Trichonephila clavipes]|nr:hypothetical protein TNCV_3842721 [Trichonephila clavipes]
MQPKPQSSRAGSKPKLKLLDIRTERAERERRTREVREQALPSEISSSNLSVKTLSTFLINFLFNVKINREERPTSWTPCCLPTNCGGRAGIDKISILKQSLDDERRRPGSFSPGSGNERKREIVLNRRPELYRGKYRCVQPKINLLKSHSYACEHNVFLWNLPDVEEVPSHDGETV